MNRSKLAQHGLSSTTSPAFANPLAAFTASSAIDEPLNVDWEGNELLLCDVLSGDGDTVYHRLETNEDHRLIHRAISHLSAREKTIIKLRFGIDCPEEKTQKEVADLLGISQSYISRLEKKIIKDLRDELSCNF